MPKSGTTGEPNGRSRSQTFQAADFAASTSGTPIFSGVDLRQSDLRGADLNGANLKSANLEGANLFKAQIDGADLTEANLRGVRFFNCPQLESALNWQSAYRDEDLACGAAIPQPLTERGNPRSKLLRQTNRPPASNCKCLSHGQN